MILKKPFKADLYKNIIICIKQAYIYERKVK